MLDQAALLAFFDRHDLAHRTVGHPAVFRVGEGLDVKASLPGAHTKNLFLKDASGRLWLISARQDTTIDLKRLPRTIGSDRLSFGKPELMLDVLGVTPGSVTAFALANDGERRVTFVLDRALAEADVVNFHPLINTATTAMHQATFRRFLDLIGARPLVVDFAALSPPAPPC